MPRRRTVLGLGAGAALITTGKAWAATKYYSYDAQGRLTGSLTASGAGVNYVSDSADNRTELRGDGFVGASVTDDSFDAQFYVEVYPDIKAAGIDPYQHYLDHGWTEGRDPSRYFSTNGYLNAYGDIAAAGLNPLLHYNQAGWHEGRNPSTLFSTTRYLSIYTDVANAGMDPLLHFLRYGFFEGRSPCGDGTYPAPT
jgi:YD repeat-containing protein